MPHYLTVFDASALRFMLRDWVPLTWFCLIDSYLALAAFGIIKSPRTAPIAVWAVFLIFLFITTIIGGSLIGSAVAARRALVSHQCQNIEGRVAHFRAIPFPKGSEHFELNGKGFDYRGDETQSGYRAKYGEAGPIHDGAWVRLCEYQGTILKLEVAT